MLRSFSHPTQPLSRSTTHCRLSVTAYSIYLQLPSILEAVPPATTQGGAMLSWQGHTNLSWLYCIIWWISYNKWFRSCIFSMYNKHYCFLSTWYVSFLGPSGKVTYHASHLPLQILCFKSITIVLGLKAMYKFCFQVYGIYICKLKHQITLNVNIVFSQINCLVFRTPPLYSNLQC
jgi:hypothetical protein